jgi:hypothetical protein
MLHFDWEVKADAAALPALLARRQQLGGRIVVFQRVTSLVFLTRRSNHYCVVDPGENRSLRGLVFSWPTLLLGWWSLTGALETFHTLAHNLLGGVDVTEQVVPPVQPPNIAASRKFARRRFALSVGLLVTTFATLFGLLLAALA